MVVTSLFSRDGIILGNHPREEGPSIFLTGVGRVGVLWGMKCFIPPLSCVRSMDFLRAAACTGIFL